MQCDWLDPEFQSPPTFLGDLLPGVGWVHEGSVLDLILDLLILVEGERPAQADVDDDAHRPHVQRAVVAFAAQHLGRQVRRRPDHRAAERLLPDDAGEAKVTKLHLQEEGRGGEKVDVVAQRQRDEETFGAAGRTVPDRFSPEGRARLRPGGRSRASGHSGRCS